MKRLLLAAVLALLPAALVADVADRDVLLTPDGTLYTIQSVANGDANRYLALTTVQDNKSSVSIIPETKTAGANWRPALTYDAETKTLFAFWIYTSNGLSSDTLGDGSFGAPKRTPSLLGVGATGPWTWTGSIDRLEDQVRKSILTTMRGPAPTQFRKALLFRLQQEVFECLHVP